MWTCLDVLSLQTIDMDQFGKKSDLPSVCSRPERALPDQWELGLKGPNQAPRESQQIFPHLVKHNMKEC